LKRGQTLGDDGLIYSWSRPVGRWYAFFTEERRNAHGLLIRRDKLDVRSIEQLRWHCYSHLEFVRRKYQDAVDRVARTNHPHYYNVDGSQRIVLTVTRSGASFRQVEQRSEPIPPDLISKIGHLEGDGLTVGRYYRRIGDWSGNAHVRASLLSRLLGVCVHDLLERTLGPRLHTDEFRTRRVVALINGRRYPILNRMSDDHSAWPDPNDLVIDVDTMSPLPVRYFDRGGVAHSAPLKRGRTKPPA